VADSGAPPGARASAASELPAAHRLETVFANLPAAIVVLRGPEHRFELVNKAYSELIGGRELVGLTVREALPEVEGQGFFELLDGVFTTGEPYIGSETPVLLDRDGSGVLQEAFLNFVYLPTRGDGGAVDGILVHAVDVTELVAARRTVEALAEELSGQRRRLEVMVEKMPAGVVIAEVPSGRLVAANQEWREFFGVSLDAVGNIEGYSVFSAYHEDGREYLPEEYPLARTVATGEVVAGEQMTIRRADGVRRIIEVNSAPIVNDGEIDTGVATFFDVTDQRRIAALVERNKALFELIAEGAPLEQALASVVAMIEEHAGHAVLASILLLDRDGIHLRHGAAPNLPEAYNRAIDGIAIGPGVGSCGTAAHLREPVVVREIATDPLWADFRELALEHDLHACWSTPIFSAAGAVLGTFALYYRSAHAPRPEEQALVEIATRTAAVAIERKRLEEDREHLLVSEQAARSDAERNLQVVEALHGVGQTINASLDLREVVQVVTDAATRLSGAEFGAFFYNVLRADGEAYTLYTLSGAPRSAFETYPMPRNTEIFDPTFKGTAVMRLDDVQADPRFGKNAPYHGLPEGHLPVRSYLAVPVKNTAGDVLGGLFFGHAQVGVFTEEAERLVVGIAAQAAVAIERAQLYVSEQTARAQAEQRAHAALSLEHVNDGVCLVDEAGVVQVWNPAASSITGLPPGEVVGRAFAQAAPSLAAAAAEIATIAAPDTGARVQTLPLAIGDRELWLAISGIRFAGGTVYTFRDRSEERRLEQMRSDIVATVSHELRTPLSAVYGAARTLGRPEIAGDARLREQFVEMIVAETDRLSRVVNQILLASELDVRTEEVVLERVDLAALARKVLDLAGLRDDEIELVLEADEVAPVAADADKLQQVVANLVDNAIKYGRAGGQVIVSVTATATGVRLGVTDFGPGIPMHEAERIFERFYRLDPQQRQGVSGTGLGLHISRALVREMGGDIWVQPSAEGRGSTFVVELRPV
jgi:PAS domain S-box-containing protein